jgi:hypothetical protein
LHRPSSRLDCLVVVGGPMRRDSWGTRWLAHEAKGQRADKLSRGVGVADAFIERLGDDEWRRPVRVQGRFLPGMRLSLKHEG